MKVLLFFFRITSLIISLAVLLGLISPWVSPSVFIIPSLLGIVFPYVYLILISLTLISLVIDKMLLRVLLPCLFMGLFFVNSFFGVYKDTNPNDGISVLSLNIRGGKSIYESPEKLQNEKILDFKSLIAKDVDILCIQEMNARVAAWLSEDSTFQYTIQAGKKGTFIASKYNFLDFGEIDFGTRVNSCVWADIDTDQGPVRVYNVHFQSNRIYDDTEKAIEQTKQYNPSVISSLQMIFNKYNKYSLIRIDQARLLKRHIENSAYPVIISGDFNETPMSYLYRYLSGGLNDTFDKGYGLGNTFPQSRPTIRIDYILISKNIDCHKFEILRNISLSDHVPIKSTLGIKK